jgi:hypothetical protein
VVPLLHFEIRIKQPASSHFNTLSEMPSINNGESDTLTRGHWLQEDLFRQCQKNLIDDLKGPLVQQGKDGTQQPSSQSHSSSELTWHLSPMISTQAIFEPMQASILDYGEEAYPEIQDGVYGKLPPPGPGESTTRCRDAYWTIIQQIRKGLNDSSIRGWLEPGFRGPICEGDGCRIETGLLFALLDFISASEAWSS